MRNKTFLFATLICLLGWCCVSCVRTTTPKGFSVSANKQVVFSSGNMWYDIYEDITGSYLEDYGCISRGYELDSNENLLRFDLFGWSGSTGDASFGFGFSFDDSDYAGDFVDWGHFFDDDDKDSEWRTLTKDEWIYLINGRSNASSLIGIARIQLDSTGTSYVNGLILLPDSWNCPKGVSFKSGFAYFDDEEGSDKAYPKYQCFTLGQWYELQRGGAVFLPASGYLFNSGHHFDNSYDQRCGFYWSATSSPNPSILGEIYCLKFDPYKVEIDSVRRRDRLSVRLVRDL